jgi:uncharacterized protein (UPF0128 family)
MIFLAGVSNVERKDSETWRVDGLKYDIKSRLKEVVTQKESNLRMKMKTSRHQN